MQIISLDTSPPPHLNAAMHVLFEEYGRFLIETQSCGYFNLAHFKQELDTLPTSYTGPGGEVLLAMADAEPAGCIAFRQSASDAASCEIKRLFIRPEFRSLGLARKLVAETLLRARARPYTRAILDTDLANMPGAAELYASFGFREYGERRGNIAFYELALTPGQPRAPEAAHAAR